MLSIFKNIIRPLFGHRLARFYPLRIGFNCLLWFFQKINLAGKVDGHLISLGSKIGLELFANVIQRPFEITVFKRQINQGDVVLDLGANIGYYTLIAANIVGENGEVFAFEPETDNFSILEKNIKLNGYKSITAVQKAVSDKTGKARLYLCREDSSMHSIYGMSNNQQFVEIETVRLDDYFKNYNNSIDFIKIDIEGAEALALQGMSSILKKNKNLKILTEFNPFLLKKSGIKPEKYLESLVGWNFKLYHIHEKEKKLELVTVKELMNKCPVGEYTNLLCSRNFIYC